MTDVRKAREVAHRKHGDALALDALERARIMAGNAGWVRHRQPRIDVTKKIEPLGDAPLVPSPGQDVGSGARKSYRDPKPLLAILERAIADRGWKAQLEVAHVTTRWPELVGETVAANCKVENFSDDGVLTLRTRSVAWETQMRALATHLDRRLAEELGEGVIKEIIINGPHVPSWKHGRYSVPGRGPRDTYD